MRQTLNNPAALERERQDGAAHGGPEEEGEESRHELVSLSFGSCSTSAHVDDKNDLTRPPSPFTFIVTMKVPAVKFACVRISWR